MAGMDKNNPVIRNPNSALPEGWRWVKLGEVCDEAKTCDPRLSPNVPFRYVDISSTNSASKRIINTRIILGKDAPSRARQLVETNDVLVATTRPNLNAVALVPAELDGEICSTGFCVLHPTAIIDATFLFFLVQARDFIDTLSREVRGMLYPAVTDNQVRSISIPLPPLPEQKRIAAKVQELMAEVEHARSACEKRLEAAKALPSVYLRQVFESDEAKRWERRRLGEVANVFSGSSAPQDEKYFQNGVYPFVRVQDLGRVGRTSSLTDVKDMVNDTAVRELSLVKATAGTILFPKSGAAIHTNSRAILGMEAYIVSHLAAVQPRERIASSDWMYFWLCTQNMANYSENIGYPSLKLSIIKQIAIPLPPFATQQHLASEVKERITQAERLCSGIEKQVEAINALPQAILRKAFSGEL